MTAPVDRLAHRREYLRAYHREWMQITGREPMVPAAVVAEHVASCAAILGSVRQVALRAGVAEATLRRLPTASWVTARVARAILAVQPARPVTAIGVTRRVQALAAIGWTCAQIAHMTGVCTDQVKTIRRGETVAAPTRRVAGAIARTYDTICMTAPETPDRWTIAQAKRAISTARRAGWAPPLAWDDDTIDDPAAQPVGHKLTATHLDLDEWLRLVRWGESPERAASRCGVTIKAVTRSAERAGRRDVAALAGNAAHRKEQSA